MQCQHAISVIDSACGKCTHTRAQMTTAYGSKRTCSNRKWIWKCARISKSACMREQACDIAPPYSLHHYKNWSVVKNIVKNVVKNIVRNVFKMCAKAQKIARQMTRQMTMCSSDRPTNTARPTRPPTIKNNDNNDNELKKNNNNKQYQWVARKLTMCRLRQ